MNQSRIRNDKNAETTAAGKVRHPHATRNRVSQEIAELHQSTGNHVLSRLLRGGNILTKPAIGRDNDPLEREADRVAENISHPAIGPASIATQGIAQGKCTECSADREPPFVEDNASSAPEMIQRHPAGPGAPLTTGVERGLRSTARGGLPIDVNARREMEERIGADFSAVRVHTDAGAAQISDKLNAHAFTLGSDIYFAEGKYQPRTPDGRRLLAHELTHVVQQGSAEQGKLIQREKKKKGSTTSAKAYREYSVLVPRSYTRIEQMYRLFERHVYGHETNDEWSCGGYCDMAKNRGNRVPFRIPTSNVGAGRKAGADERGRPLRTPTELLSVDPSKPAQDPEQAMRLYELVREHLHLEPGTEGEDIVRFAHFLELNKGKIEGILQVSKTGEGLTEAQIQKIIDMYGKFIASEPLDIPEKPETLPDFDKVFKYDPNWQKMSKQDRQMLIDFARMKPEDIESGKLELPYLTQTMKEEIALKLVDSWAAEVKEAAAAAFSDPLFLISLVLTIAVYIGLWLTPDPTFVTKLAAGTLTAVMWAMFAWEDIWKTAVEYSTFGENVKKARTVAELKAAGNRMAKKIGAVGFDILMMIATWGLGKAAGPKLRAAGARRGVVRAETGVRTAAADPAAGVPKTAEGPAKTLLNDAKSSAKGSTATAVLEALEPKLDAAGKEGLRALRAGKAGDLGTYKALESQAGKGVDINHFLAEKAATPAAKATATANLLAAEAKLARAKLIEADTLADPALRKAARSAQMNELVSRFKARLSQMGLLDQPNIRKVLQNHNLKDLTGALGEAISRQLLKASVSGNPNARVVSNLALVKEVPGYKTIAEWQRATNASPGDVAKMFERNGKLYQSLGEVDSMVVEDVPKGKPKATIIEEVKTGAADQPVRALEQLTNKALPALQQIAAGDKSVKLFELAGKKELGTERTNEFDFSGNIKVQTRGPATKGFQESLGYDPEVLDETAKSLIRDGLPPAQPQTVPPLTGARPKGEE